MHKNPAPKREGGRNEKVVIGRWFGRNVRASNGTELVVYDPETWAT